MTVIEESFFVIRRSLRKVNILKVKKKKKKKKNRYENFMSSPTKVAVVVLNNDVKTQGNNTI